MVSSFMRLVFLVLFALLAALPSVQATPSINTIETNVTYWPSGIDFSLLTKTDTPTGFTITDDYGSSSWNSSSYDYVILTFSEPVEVTGLTMIQHANGINHLKRICG
jgi:hypothetical protein